MSPTALILTLALALPAPAHAYDIVIDAPLRELGGAAVVGHVQGATPTTVRFRDGTHARVTFRSPGVEIRGEIDLDEGDVRIRSAQHMVLTGTPFRIEVEPGTELHLVNGLRREVRLENELSADGLDLAQTHLRVGSEATLPMRHGEPRRICQPVHLWAEPRVRGPVIRTRERGRFVSMPAAGAPGWSEVWLMEGGVWLRGYTWEAVRCRRDGAMSSTGGIVEAASGPETRVMSADTRIASSERAPWTVRVREAMQVEIVRVTSHTYFAFPLSEGRVLIEGVVLP